MNKSILIGDAAYPVYVCAWATAEESLSHPPLRQPPQPNKFLALSPEAKHCAKTTKIVA